MKSRVKPQQVIYTTLTMAKQLGLDQDTVRKYASMNGWGTQPGGPGTPRFFTRDDVALFARAKRKARKFLNVEVIELRL
jgi:hypothetical protein